MNGVCSPIRRPRIACAAFSRSCSTNASSCRRYGIRAISQIHRDQPYVLRRERHDVPRRLRAGRIDHRAVRRQLELARTDLVPDQLPARRGAAEVPSLLRRQLHRRVPDRIGPMADAGAGRRGSVAAAVAHLPATTSEGRRPVFGARRDLSERSALARPHPVPRVLPRRHRRRRRRQPPDRLDRPGCETDSAERRACP